MQAKNILNEQRDKRKIIRDTEGNYMKNRLWLLLFIAFICKYNSIHAQLKIMPLGDSITEGVLLSANLSYPDGTNKNNPEQGLTPDGYTGSLMSGDRKSVV